MIREAVTIDFRQLVGKQEEAATFQQCNKWTKRPVTKQKMCAVDWLYVVFSVFLPNMLTQSLISTPDGSVKTGKDTMLIKATERFVDEVQFMADAADAARNIAMEHFRSPLRVEDKADNSPVTVADRMIERSLRNRITERFPDHGIFGEEEAPVNLSSRHLWVVDPIDGTKSFVTGHPLFGGLLALLQDGTPCLGQIDMPALNERWQGCVGVTSTFNGSSCQTSSCTRLAEAFVYTTDPFAFEGGMRDVFGTIAATARLVRFGGDCYSYGLLASGHCDLVVETGLQPYDYLPLVQIIEGAGGVITDWAGQPLHLNSEGHVVAAATPELHAETLLHLGGLLDRSIT